jgi:hypothetical protein
MNIRQWRSLGKRDLFSRVNEPNAQVLSGRETDTQSYPSRSPRSASTPGWTARAPSAAGMGRGDGDWTHGLPGYRTRVGLLGLLCEGRHPQAQGLRQA